MKEIKDLPIVENRNTKRDHALRGFNIFDTLIHSDDKKNTDNLEMRKSQ